MNQEIKALSDREAIRNLRTLYAHHLDSNNIAALDEVFSNDAVVDVTVGRMEGIDAITGRGNMRPSYATITGAVSI